MSDFQQETKSLPEGKFTSNTPIVWNGYKMNHHQWMKTSDGIISIATYDVFPMGNDIKIIGTFDIPEDSGTGKALIVKSDGTKDYSAVEPILA